MVLAVTGAAFGLDQDGAVGSLVAVQGRGRRVAQDGDGLHFVQRHVVDGAFNAVHQNQQVVFRGSLCAAHVHVGAISVIAHKASILQGGQAQQATVEGIFQRNGCRLLQLFSADGLGGSGGHQETALDAHAQIYLAVLVVRQGALCIHAASSCRKQGSQAYFNF